MQLALEITKELNEGYNIKVLVDFITGNPTQQLKLYKFTEYDSFGCGKEYDENFWNSIFRQALLRNYLFKDIDNYGLMKISDLGHDFMKEPSLIQIPLNQIFPEDTTPDDESGGGTAALDEALVKLLDDVRKQEAKKHKVPPFVIFTDPSNEDMATQYPVSMEDMASITGVSKGKAERYGAPFIKVISKYVEDNEIERPMDFMVRQIDSGWLCLGRVPLQQRPDQRRRQGVQSGGRSAHGRQKLLLIRCPADHSAAAQRPGRGGALRVGGQGQHRQGQPQSLLAFAAGVPAQVPDDSVRRVQFAGGGIRQQFRVALVDDATAGQAGQQCRQPGTGQGVVGQHDESQGIVHLRQA